RNAVKLHARIALAVALDEGLLQIDAFDLVAAGREQPAPATRATADVESTRPEGGGALRQQRLEHETLVTRIVVVEPGRGAHVADISQRVGIDALVQLAEARTLVLPVLLGFVTVQTLHYRWPSTAWGPAPATGGLLSR